MGEVSEMGGFVWINESKKVPDSIVVELTLVTSVVLKLTSTLVSIAIMVPTSIAFEIVAEVDRVWVEWFLEASDVRGDEFCVFGDDEAGTMCEDDWLNCGMIEVV